MRQRQSHAPNSAATCDGFGIVVRLLNPTDDTMQANLHTTLPVARAIPLRLDETPEGPALAIEHGAILVTVPAHAMRTLDLA